MFQANMVLHDILLSEGRYVRSVTWLVATTVYAGCKTVWGEVMKTVCVMVCLTVLCSGCMSTGGFVMGPISYSTAKLNESDVTKRAMENANIPQDKKPQVFRAVNVGMRDNEIAAGVGVDLISLKEAIQGQSLTFGEAATQVAGCLADSALYGFAAKRTGALQYVRDGFGTKNTSTSTPTSSAGGQGSISIVNNTGTVNLNQGNQGGN
jgi:hypothetical protein